MREGPETGRGGDADLISRYHAFLKEGDAIVLPEGVARLPKLQAGRVG